MKKFLLTTAALALLSTTAHADDVRTATMMSITMFYDRDCAKIPGLEPMIKLMLAQIPADLAIAGVARGREVYRLMGTAKFCETYKPVIDKTFAK